MRKSIFWIILLILVVGGGGVIISDITKANRIATLVNQLQLNLTKSEKGNEAEIKVKVVGELPASPVVLTIFADNRYLELVPGSWSDKDVVTYIGQTAGGVETNFEIPRNFDGEINIRYIQKQKGTSNPLIYAYLESKVKRIILGDIMIRTEIEQQVG